MKDSMCILELPMVMLCSFLSSWLTTGELGRVDSAMCNASLRTAFLKAIAAPNFITSGCEGPCDIISDLQLHWLFRRRVKMRALSMTDPDVNFSTSDCEVFCRLECLRIFYRNRLELVTKACMANLKHLALNFYALDEGALNSIALRCPQLQTLRIGQTVKLEQNDPSYLKNARLRKQFTRPKYPSMKSLHSISCSSFHVAERFWKLIGQSSPNLLHVSIVINPTRILGEAYFTPSRFASCMITAGQTGLQSLRFRCSHIDYREFELTGLEKFTRLTRLTLSGFTNLVDEQVIGALSPHMKNLTEISLDNCKCLLHKLRFTLQKTSQTSPCSIWLRQS
jgi:hypothetical protein